LKRVSDGLYNTINQQDISEETNEQVEFIENVSLLGKKLNSTLQGINVPIKGWLKEAKKSFGYKLYSKREQRYIHYKNKLTMLMAELEELLITGKTTIKSKKAIRVDRVIWL
jgi:hypothetical protein